MCVILKRTLVGIAVTRLLVVCSPETGSPAKGGVAGTTRTSGTDAAERQRTMRLYALRERLPPVERRVLMLGLDGFDWDYVLPLVEAGRMPNLSRLLERGTWGQLRTLSRTLSPLIWTTAANGVSPEVHGILDFVEPDRETGEPIPVTSGRRKVPALRSIASALVCRVNVVGDGDLAGGRGSTARWSPTGDATR